MPDALDSVPFPFFVCSDGVVVRSNRAAESQGFCIGRRLGEFAPDLPAVRNENVPFDIPTIAVETERGVCYFSGKAVATFGELRFFLHDVTHVLQTSEELGGAVIETEVQNRVLERKMRASAALADLGAALFALHHRDEVINALLRSLRKTGFFLRVDFFTPADFENRATSAESLRHGRRAFSVGAPLRLPDGEHSVYLPIMGREAPHGIVRAEFGPEADPATLADEDLRSFGTMTSFALDNVDLTADLDESFRDLAFRNRVGQTLQHAMTQPEVEHALRTFLGEQFGIFWFALVAKRDPSAYPPELAEAMEHAFRGHRTIRPTPRGCLIAHPIRLTGIGSESETSVYCAVAAISRDPHALAGHRLRLFLAIMDMAAIALRNARLYQDVRAHSVAVQFLNEELARTVTDLRAANEIKSRFVSIVSHEFRTPLTSIYSYVDTLLLEGAGLPPETSARFLGIVKEETERLTRLINHLLDLSRMQSHDTPLRSVSVSIADVVRRAESVLRPVAARKEMVLEVEVAATSATISGDPDALLQVVTNIGGNAIRYTPPRGSVKIFVEEDTDFVYIRVDDTGIGIPSDSIDAIFGEFYTLEHARESRHVNDDIGAERGTGLGLSIAKAIVERHGGRIGVESQVGAGSSFTVRLPRKGGSLE